MTREEHREYIRRWRAEHPERTRAQQERAHARRLAKRTVRHAVCEACGAEFEIAVGERKRRFCSAKCMNRARDRRRFAREKAARAAKRAERAATVETRKCAFCGSAFTVRVGSRKMYCCDMCMRRRWKYGSYTAWQAVRARHQEKKAARTEARVARDSFGLTPAERDAVVRAQAASRDALWAASQSWSPEQRKFAKKRYMEFYKL